MRGRSQERQHTAFSHYQRSHRVLIARIRRATAMCEREQIAPAEIESQSSADDRLCRLHSSWHESGREHKYKKSCH